MKLEPLKLTVVIVTATVALGACGKKKLDKNVDRLVKVVVENDYAALKEMAHTSLVEKYPPAKLEYLSNALKKLGAFKERTMKGIEARSGRIRRGKYKLKFEKAEIRLTLTLKDGKLIGFMFSGEAFEKAAKEVRNESYKEFKVIAFKFFGPDGKPKNNIYKAGQPIRVKIGVSGLTRTPKGLHVRAAIRVLNPQGQAVITNPNFLNNVLPLKPDDPPVATLSANLKLPVPSAYKIQLRIFDVGGNRHVDYQQAVVVVGK